MSDQATLATEGLENSQAGELENQTQAKTEGGDELKLDGFEEKDKATLERFKTPKDLAKSYLELLRLKSAAIPEANANPEEWKAFFKKLGRPESAADYELDRVYLPDGKTEIDPGNEAYRAAALEANLTKEQAQVLHRWAAKSAVDQLIQIKRKAKESRDRANQVLRNEYGVDLDTKKALIPAIEKMYNNDDFIQFLNEGPGNDPRLVRFLIWVGDQFSEETLRGGRPVLTVEEREEGVLDYSTTRPEVTGKNRVRSVR